MYLAFNLNILYTLKNTFIQKIYISQSNIKTRNTRLIIPMNQSLVPTRFNKKFFLRNYLNILKLSGFIKSIESIKIIIDNKRYLKLYIEFNPLIQTIRVENYQVLLISSFKLQKILKKYVGLPVNFKLLNTSLQKIFLWYKLQGFKWVRIQLIYNNKYNYINIKIIEGKLLSGQIICTNYFKNSNYKFINNAIKSEIKPLYGHILNQISLESKLKMIKQTYFLEDISYKVIYCKTGLYILIKYVLTKEKHVKISYISNYIFNFFLYSYLKFTTNLCKTQNISIDKYKFKYTINLKSYIQEYNLIHTTIYLVNLYIDQYLQSLKFCSFFSNILIYSFNILWIKDRFQYIQQKLFVDYFINFEIKNDYCTNKYIILAQKIYYLTFKYCNNCISIQRIIDSINKCNKYKQEIYTNLSIYRIKITYNTYMSFFNLLIHSSIQTNYYLLLYLDNYYYKYTLIHSKLFSLYINQALIIKIENMTWNIGIKFNVLRIILDQFKLFTMLLMNYNIMHKNSYNSLSHLYINYSIFAHKYYKLYIFNKNIYGVKLYKSSNFIKKYKSLFGVGMQIYIPFQQIKYIRVEYIINMKKIIYLFIDKFSN